ncbi:conserved hypothetical protein [Trichinella spiralis]|uniref:hypothetical protein n=1 Tax=Trichinella spiralis TaxID=6334 RepID=UPI0001EFE2E8|nr:conserved hypothetical protein [Trichinella spiralis]
MFACSCTGNVKCTFLGPEISKQANFHVAKLFSVHVFSSKHSNIAVCDRWNEQNFENLKPIIQSGLENDARINTTVYEMQGTLLLESELKLPLTTAPCNGYGLIKNLLTKH